MTAFALIIIVLGIILLVSGSRLAIFGAGIGALLGIGILRFLPGAQDNLLWLSVPIGLAILFALGGGLAKGFINLITLAFGALAGGAIVLAVLDLFVLDLGITTWILALVGAVIGAGLASRFTSWVLIFLAAFVGALLCVRGLQMLIPAFDGALASLLGLILAGVGIAYQGRLFGKRKPE